MPSLFRLAKSPVQIGLNFVNKLAFSLPAKLSVEFKVEPGKCLRLQTLGFSEFIFF